MICPWIPRWHTGPAPQGSSTSGGCGPSVLLGSRGLGTLSSETRPQCQRGGSRPCASVCLDLAAAERGVCPGPFISNTWRFGESSHQASPRKQMMETRPFSKPPSSCFKHRPAQVPGGELCSVDSHHTCSPAAALRSRVM